MSESDQNPFNYPFRSMTDFSDELYEPNTGVELEVMPTGIGPTVDVVVAEGRVYALLEAGLAVLEAESLKELGRLDGLLSARQVAVLGSIAIVTARECGVYVIDVSDSGNPKLLSAYDPVEFATGVHLARPDLAILTNRHYGLEFVDLAVPSSPRFMSTILVGEAQSVFSLGAIAYAGVWYEKELVLVDFSDPRSPKIVGRSALDGFGDGVQVRQELAFVATGHHSALQRDPRTFEQARHITLDMLERGYGKGHGVEIHNVSDPKNPRLVNVVKSPPGFCSPDTWRLTLHGQWLVQTDSGSGAFVYDITDPARPVPTAFAVLPPFENHRQPRTLSIQRDRHPVTGAAIVGNTLLLAGKTSDLYRCDLSRLEREAARQEQPVSPFLLEYPEPDTPQPSKALNLLDTTGQVHWVASDGEVLFAAAGEDGLYVLDPTSRSVLAHQQIDGSSQHVFCSRGLVYVSQVTGGLTIWKRGDTTLRQVGSWHDGPGVRQVMIPESLPLGLAIVGAGEFAVLDISDPAEPICVARHQLIGHAYARLLADRLVEDSYALGATQGSGLNWFDLSGLSGARALPPSSGARLCPITEGFTVHQGRALVVQAGGYYFASPDNPQLHGEASHIREPNCFFSGNPQSVGPDRIVLTNRATGSARVLDVSDESAPKTISYLQLPGNPDRPIRVGDHLVFPCGRSGLCAVACP